MGLDEDQVFVSMRTFSHYSDNKHAKIDAKQYKPRTENFVGKISPDKLQLDPPTCSVPSCAQYLVRMR